MYFIVDGRKILHLRSCFLDYWTILSPVWSTANILTTDSAPHHGRHRRNGCSGIHLKHSWCLSGIRTNCWVESVRWWWERSSSPDLSFWAQTGGRSFGLSLDAHLSSLLRVWLGNCYPGAFALQFSWYNPIIIPVLELTQHLTYLFALIICHKVCYESNELDLKVACFTLDPLILPTDDFGTDHFFLV